MNRNGQKVMSIFHSIAVQILAKTSDLNGLFFVIYLFLGFLGLIPLGFLAFWLWIALASMSYMNFSVFGFLTRPYSTRQSYKCERWYYLDSIQDDYWICDRIFLSFNKNQKLAIFSFGPIGRFFAGDRAIPIDIIDFTFRPDKESIQLTIENQLFCVYPAEPELVIKEWDEISRSAPELQGKESNTG